jgi:hypothetical protein
MSARFIRTTAFVLAASAAAVTTAQAVAANRPARAALPMPTPDAVAQAATSTFTGSFTLTFNITVKPGLPATGYPINCSATVTPIDSSGLTYSDSKTVLGARSGSTATCSITIYYSWNLANASAMVLTQYEVTAIGSGTSLVDRFSIGSLPTIVLPANGGSSSRTVNVTI